MYLLETFRLVYILHQAPFCRNLISEERGVKWNCEHSSSNSNKSYPTTSFNIPESLVREVSHVYVLHSQDRYCCCWKMNVNYANTHTSAYGIVLSITSIRLVITGISFVI